METPLSNSGNPPPKPLQRAPLALSGLDFKLLKVFKAVVEAGGFSAAQNELNVGLAAISKQISDLEIRIGMRALACLQICATTIWIGMATWRPMAPPKH